MSIHWPQLLLYLWISANQRGQHKSTTEEDPAENFPTVGQAVLGTALIFLLENLRAQSFTINSGLDLRILSVL